MPRKDEKMSAGSKELCACALVAIPEDDGFDADGAYDVLELV